MDASVVPSMEHGGLDVVTPEAALARAQAAMPVELRELRPGRRVAVHVREPEGATAATDQPPDLAVLCHGSCASMLQWLAQAEALAAHGYRVVAYDWLGCGRSEKPEDWNSYATDELVQDLGEVLRQYSVDSAAGRVVVFAHSAGCSFALRVAAELRAELPVSALVLLSPLVARPGSLALFRLPLWVLTRIHPLLSAGFEAGALSALTRRGESAAHRELLLLCQAVNGSNPMHMCKAYYRQLQCFELAAASSLNELPILMMAGEEDGLVPSAANLEALASALPWAEMALLPDCSHQLMQEAPVTVNARALAFLDKLPSHGSKRSAAAESPGVVA